jgi:hypothetical protein
MVSNSLGLGMDWHSSDWGELSLLLSKLACAYDKPFSTHSNSCFCEVFLSLVMIAPTNHFQGINWWKILLEL